VPCSLATAQGLQLPKIPATLLGFVIDFLDGKSVAQKGGSNNPFPKLYLHNWAL